MFKIGKKSLLGDEELKKKVGIATDSKERKNEEDSWNVITPCQIGDICGRFDSRSLENFAERAKHVDGGNHHSPDGENTSDLQRAQST
jgi:hypothetical protein